MGFWFAAFVFDRNESAIAVKFADVGLTLQAETTGDERQSSRHSYSRPGFGRPFVRPFMQHASLGGEKILLPKPLNVDQSALSLAVKQMLEGRDGKQVGQSIRKGSGFICAVRSSSEYRYFM
jgi:hypothetical protein